MTNGIPARFEYTLVLSAAATAVGLVPCAIAIAPILIGFPASPVS